MPDDPGYLSEIDDRCPPGRRAPPTVTPSADHFRQDVDEHRVLFVVSMDAGDRREGA
jgi:hypothetical protein